MSERAPLRVLVLEDSPSDAKLIQHALRSVGWEIVSERIESAAELRRTLHEQRWDVVLSDWSMPSFTALDALEIVRQLGHDLPFIIVSGTIGEERAVAAMRAGAHDYVLKDNLARLAPAVEREVREAAERARRRVAEDEVRRQETRFRTLIERSSDVVCVVAADRYMRYVSPAARRVLGKDPAELVGRPAFPCAHDDDAVRLDALLDRLLVAPGASESLEFRAHADDGSARWVQAYATNHLDEPFIDGIVFHIRDIDAHRRAVEQLKVAEARYRRIVETTSDGVWTLDAEGRVTFLNGRMAEMLGRPADEVLGRSAFELVDPPERSTPPLQGEFRLVRPDGSQVRALFESKAIQGPDGAYEGLLGMARDITAMRLTEEAKRQAEEALTRSDRQLRHAQKMEAVGRLAGGVAHDFNNLLSVILSYSTMLLQELQTDPQTASDLAEIVHAGKRAAELTQQLLAFSRQQVIEPRVIDLNSVLLGMERMCRRILGEDIELAVVLDDEPGMVLIDPSAFEQVIMNLIINARDAMPRGGKLTLEMSRVELDRTFAESHLGVHPGLHIRITVTDTGCGMDAATMQQIFEPFFTTKETGKGTGLGLSTVFGIVRQAGGTVWVYSEVGVGTSFKILLPCVERPLTARRSVGLISNLRGSETVLLVEDDDAVRAVARGILRRNGYQIIEARNPAAALALASEVFDQVDVLLTDIVMPGMSGPELARRLRERRPSLKVLCMSGYTDEAVVLHGLMDADLAFLQKPLLPDTLLRKLREVLNRKA